MRENTEEPPLFRLPTASISAVEHDRRPEPMRPGPEQLARQRAFNKLMNAWIDSHPDAPDMAMWDDPEFIRAVNVLDGRDPEHGLNEA